MKYPAAEIIARLPTPELQPRFAIREAGPFPPDCSIIRRHSSNKPRQKINRAMKIV